MDSVSVWTSQLASLNEKWLFFVANKSKFFRTNRGNLGGFAKAYSLSRQISIVLSTGTLVNSELTSKEHMNSPLWVYCLAHSAKLKESYTEKQFVEIGWRTLTRCYIRWSTRARVKFFLNNFRCTHSQQGSGGQSLYTLWQPLLTIRLLLDFALQDAKIKISWKLSSTVKVLSCQTVKFGLCGPSVCSLFLGFRHFDTGI